MRGICFTYVLLSWCYTYLGVIEIICRSRFKNESEIVFSGSPAMFILGSAGGSADLFPEIIAGTGHNRWEFPFLV